MKEITEIERATNTRTGELSLWVYCNRCGRGWQIRMNNVLELMKPNPRMFDCKHCLETRSNETGKEAVQQMAV